MKSKSKLYTLFLSIILSSSLSAVAGQSADTSHGDARLIAALIHVESRGNDYAIGDRGRREMAYGALQIRKPCVDDVNRRYGTRYRAKEMLGNRALSVWVCEHYIDMYAQARYLGHAPTLEDRARIWNGGPAGWKHPATKRYWMKVQLAMAMP